VPGKGLRIIIDSLLLLLLLLSTTSHSEALPLMMPCPLRVFSLRRILARHIQGARTMAQPREGWGGIRAPTGTHILEYGIFGLLEVLGWVCVDRVRRCTYCLHRLVCGY
jgi:hypothetical protein